MTNKDDNMSRKKRKAKNFIVSIDVRIDLEGNPAIVFTYRDGTRMGKPADL
jgi:hypothetical protein